MILEVLERYGINVDYLPSGIEHGIAGGVGPEGGSVPVAPMLGDLQKEEPEARQHPCDRQYGHRAPP